MAKNFKLINYLPFYDSRTGEFKEICRAEQEFIDGLWNENDFILKESFALTADEYGISRFEAMLGLSSAGLELEHRRENVLFKLMGDTPYTMNTVYRRLKLLCGGNITFEYGENPYTVKIRLGLSNLNQFDIIKELLYKVVPANISIDIDAKYGVYSDFGSMTHGEMEVYTHTDLRLMGN